MIPSHSAGSRAERITATPSEQSARNSDAKCNRSAALSAISGSSIHSTRGAPSNKCATTVRARIPGVSEPMRDRPNSLSPVRASRLSISGSVLSPSNSRTEAANSSDARTPRNGWATPWAGAYAQRAERTVPASGASRPAAHISNVVLPEPALPATPTHSPRATCNDTSVSAVTSAEQPGTPARNRRVTDSRVSAAVGTAAQYGCVRRETPPHERCRHRITARSSLREARRRRRLRTAPCAPEPSRRQALAPQQASQRDRATSRR